MKQWMKDNWEPFSTLKSYMQKTVLNRSEWIEKTPQLTIREVMKEYPRLINVPGMVEIDFATLYPDVADNLFLRFTPETEEKIICYADTQTEKWTKYLNIATRNLNSDEEKRNAAICLLPCVFPTGRKNKKRCTTDEALCAFIDCQPVGTNTPKYLETASRWPFVLAIGIQCSPTQVFVIIGGQGLEPPNLSCSSWEFIEKVLYGIEDHGKQKTTPAVVAMRATLK
ncbi:uncharacterized protein LOC124450899 [Xenia sp. Carnegie-2017]|uniref:uncharacterized protein LOC124450899 n=1 Tax=Xenia sp. Carnegie-2017 TaxID=2897299 RepID=UPI001F045A37|nr:uncharacterized protein LOC124450899 [Xenia sp. Carnegie-2017]